MSSPLANAPKTGGADNAGEIVDGWTAPEAAFAALSSGGRDRVVIKLTPRAHAAVSTEYAPTPEAPILAAAERGKPDLSGLAEARKVSVGVEERSWGASATVFHKFASEILVHLGSDEALSFAGAIADDRTAAEDALAPLARALASFLGVQLDGVADRETQDGRAVEGASLGPASKDLSLSFEGDHIVLRDYGGIGPRASAPLYRAIALSCLVPSVVSLGGFAWFLTRYLADSSTGIGFLLASFAVGAVLGVAAFAFFGVWRHARAYTANSTALAWFCDDRVVVAPWVSRDGAVGVRPEGRLGAAIRTAEVSGTSLADRDGRHAVVLETAHGPIDVLETDDRSVAEHFAKVVERAVRWVASPEKKRTALMRAHERRGSRGAAAET